MREIRASGSARHRAKRLPSTGIPLSASNSDAAKRPDTETSNPAAHLLAALEPGDEETLEGDLVANAGAPHAVFVAVEAE